MANDSPNVVSASTTGAKLPDGVVDLNQIDGTDPVLGCRVFTHYNGPTDQLSGLCAGMCVLELKQSAAGLRSKSRLTMAPGDVASYLARVAGARADAALLPCMTTWYQRSALTDPEDRIRITLDRRVRFCVPTPVGSPCTGPEPREIIAESKVR